MKISYLREGGRLESSRVESSRVEDIQQPYFVSGRMIRPSKHDDVHYEDADGSMMSTSIIEIGLSTFYDAKLG